MIGRIVAMSAAIYGWLTAVAVTAPIEWSDHTTPAHPSHVWIATVPVAVLAAVGVRRLAGWLAAPRKVHAYRRPHDLLTLTVPALARRALAWWLAPVGGHYTPTPTRSILDQPGGAS